MSNPLDKDTKIILKLDLGEKGVRRIPLSKLWDESRSAVSYDLLVKLALHYNDINDIPPNSLPRDDVAVSTTYVDEDGDEITISSDEELADAFGQFVDSIPPVVRAKAVVTKTAPQTGTAAPAATTKYSRLEHVKRQRARTQATSAKRAIRANCANARMQKQAAAAAARTSSPTAPATSDPPVVIKLPPVNVPPVAPARKVNGNIHVYSNTNMNVNTKNTPDTFGCDPNFIHGRHTCDGCLTTPINGIRYHAINMPDYDLCSNCHSNYQGTDIVFRPMQLDRDRHLQARWKRRQIRLGLLGTDTSTGAGVAKKVSDNGAGGRAPSQSQSQSCSGTTRKVIDSMDDALKEAIRRSLVDAWPSKNQDKKETEEPEGKVEAEADSNTVAPEEVKVAEVVSTDDTTAKKEQEEKDIHVSPAVVDISAGNDHTQRALDNMDPKVKQAISRSLNDFFLRRTRNQNQNKLSEKGEEYSLSPDEETQKKIDAMNDKMKEAIRRSLNDFFATRRATKENQKGAVDPPASEIESKGDSGDDIQRTQEVLDTMDPEMREKIRRSLNDFFARRMNKNDTEDITVNEEDTTTGIHSVVVDIVVDDDDDLSEGTVVTDAEDTHSNISETETETKDEDATGSTNSDGGSKDEWQMVTEDDEMIAMAAQMLGSALFQSDSSIHHSV